MCAVPLLAGWALRDCGTDLVNRENSGAGAAAEPRGMRPGMAAQNVREAASAWQPRIARGAVRWRGGELAIDRAAVRDALKALQRGTLAS